MVWSPWAWWSSREQEAPSEATYNQHPTSHHETSNTATPVLGVEGLHTSSETSDPRQPILTRPSTVAGLSALSSNRDKDSSRVDLFFADETNELPPKTSLNRDEVAYEELKTLFAAVDADATHKAAKKAKEVVSEAPPDYSDSIYEAKMSCANAFDQAYYCNSVGGQLNNIYRYGALRSCSDLWAQWRFCMRTKTMSERESKTKIREFNREKSVKYKRGPSSEDVWNLRSKGDEVKNLFWMTENHYSDVGKGEVERT